MHRLSWVLLRGVVPAWRRGRDGQRKGGQAGAKPSSGRAGAHVHCGEGQVEAAADAVTLADPPGGTAAV